MWIAAEIAAMAPVCCRCFAVLTTSRGVTSSEQLPPGKSTIHVGFKYDGDGLAKGGTVTMFLNDKKVGEGRVDKTIYVRFSADETFDTGLDTGLGSANSINTQYKFTGTLKKIEIDIAPTKFGALDQQQIDKANKAVRKTAE